MRVCSSLTARQLRSVAARYRGGLAAIDSHVVSAGGLRRWWAALRDGRRSSVVPTGSRDHRLGRLEAVLFLAREPLGSRKLSQLANLADGTEARTLVRRLNELYDREGRAFHVVRVAGGYQLMTRPQFAAWVRRLEHVPRETRLSAPALETLAVVAYRQPVLRAEIEAVRGVSCDEILRQLMERNLVRISGRSDELGRPYLYSTTRYFLQVFGLDSLDDLPPVEPCPAGDASAGRPTVAAERDLPSPDEIGDHESDGAQDQQKESSMPAFTLPDVDADQLPRGVSADDVVTPQAASTFDDDEDEEFDDFFEEDEEYDEEYEEEDEDLEGDWQEVDDEEDEDWEEEDSDWEYDDEDEEEDWE